MNKSILFFTSILFVLGFTQCKTSKPNLPTSPNCSIKPQIKKVNDTNIITWKKIATEKKGYVLKYSNSTRTRTIFISAEKDQINIYEKKFKLLDFRPSSDCNVTKAEVVDVDIKLLNRDENSQPLNNCNLIIDRNTAPETILNFINQNGFSCDQVTRPIGGFNLNHLGLLDNENTYTERVDNQIIAISEFIERLDPHQRYNMVLIQCCPHTVENQSR